MQLSRRSFIQTAGAFTCGFTGLSLLMQRAGTAATGALMAEGFGPLRPDPNGLLDLPDGFSYRIVAQRGDAMADGLLFPGRPDGMAAFPGPDGTTVLVCNHENSSDEYAESAYGEGNALASSIDRKYFFDHGFGKRPGLGGTSNIVFDTRTAETLRRFMSLRGTNRNCAGGPTPWGTWITCEETVQLKDEHHEQDHGWCFEVPAKAEPFAEEPRPLIAMGRFNHEAVAVNPASGYVYQTEDRDDGLVYRFIPNQKEKLHEGGRLEVLGRKGVSGFDTRNWGWGKTVKPGDSFEVVWIPIDNVESPEDDLRYRGFDMGAARFARGEGMWYGNDAIYFACTNGGAGQHGQVWRYVPSPLEGTPDEASQPGRLHLFVEPNDDGLIDNCDNVTVAPWGDLILCEDGSGEQYLVGVTPEGGIYKFARNADKNSSELAGACFSPDGSTLFFNIQKNGLTLAVTGPWHTRKLSV